MDARRFCSATSAPIHTTIGGSTNPACDIFWREAQELDTAALARRQELQTLTMQRRLRALELVEKRESRSLETALLKERRIEERERTSREPSREPHTDVFNKAARPPIDLSKEFERATQGGEGNGDTTGESSDEVAPKSEITIQRRRRTRDR